MAKEDPGKKESLSRPSEEVEFRLDSAHRRRGQTTREAAEEAAGELEPIINESMATAPAETSEAVSALRQLRNHASQLASHLQGDWEDIKRRTTDLDGRTVDLEDQMRSAKVWLQKEDGSLAQRIEEVDGRETAAQSLEQELAERDSKLNEQQQYVSETSERLREEETSLRADIARHEEQLERTRQATVKLLETRHHSLAEIRRERQKLTTEITETKELGKNLLGNLERRRVAIEREAAADRKRLKTDLHSRYVGEAERRQADVAVRTGRLERAEALLASEQEQTATVRAELDAHERKLKEEQHESRESFAQRRDRIERQLGEKQEELERRGRQLDGRKEALNQLHRQVADTQRETLEIRLATEELWSKLADKMGSAQLTQSVTAIRTRLEENYDGIKAQVDREREELTTLREELAGRYDEFVAQRHESRAWLSRRQEEIEQQAAVLVRREQELDRQQTEIRNDRDVLKRERSDYQQQIRELLSQQRRETQVTS